MTRPIIYRPDPTLDLVLERVVDVPKAAGGGISAFTAVISLATHGKGTKYTALAMHKTEAERKSHEAMGFHDGWGKALDQLVDLVKSMKAPG